MLMTVTEIYTSNTDLIIRSWNVKFFIFFLLDWYCDKIRPICVGKRVIRANSIEQIPCNVDYLQ